MRDYVKHAFIGWMLLNLASCTAIPTHLTDEEITTAVAATFFSLILMYPGQDAVQADYWVRPVGTEKYHILAKESRFSQNGAEIMFNRGAEEVATRNGCDSYEILKYKAGIENIYRGARRVSEGVILCIKEPGPKPMP